MSILIKGMEMPKNGKYILCSIRSDGKVITDLITGGCEEYEAIELPPHGRLIDADAAAKQGWTISRTYSASPNEMVYEVKTMDDEVLPTIIPAEPKES